MLCSMMLGVWSTMKIRHKCETSEEKNNEVDKSNT